MQINNINTRILVGAGFVVGIIVMVGVILFLILPSKDDQQEQPTTTPLVDTSPAPIKDAGEIIKEGKMAELEITDEGFSVAALTVQKGGSLNIINSSSKDIEIQIRGGYYTDLKIKSGEAVFSPEFRTRGEYTLDDMTHKRKLVITATE